MKGELGKSWMDYWNLLQEHWAIYIIYKWYFPCSPNYYVQMGKLDSEKNGRKKNWFIWYMMLEESSMDTLDYHRDE